MKLSLRFVITTVLAFTVLSVPGLTLAQNNHVRFTATLEKSPLGKSVAVVKVTAPGVPERVVVEIPNGAPKLTPIQRAQIIANELQRINDTASGDWWNELQRSKINSEFVVAHNKAKRGYVLTADRQWAARWGQSPVVYPKVLIAKIVYALDPTKRQIIIRPAIELLPEERLIKAIDLNHAGLTNLAKGNKPMAEANFSKAIELSPDYLDARENLCKLYAETSKTKAAAVEAELTKLRPAVESRKQGDAEADAGHWANAEKLYRKALSQCNTCLSFYFCVAEACKQQKQDDERRDVLKAALKLTNLAPWQRDAIKDAMK